MRIKVICCKLTWSKDRKRMVRIQIKRYAQKLTQEKYNSNRMWCKLSSGTCSKWIYVQTNPGPIKAHNRMHMWMSGPTECKAPLRWISHRKTIKSSQVRLRLDTSRPYPVNRLIPQQTLFQNKFSRRVVETIILILKQI